MKKKEEVSEREGAQAYVYLLLCADGSYYSGYTTDPERRLAAHNSGRGAKYTRSRRPCILVYTEACASKGEALKRECALKKLSHEEKRALAEGAAAERAGKSRARKESSPDASAAAQKPYAGASVSRKGRRAGKGKGKR